MRVEFPELEHRMTEVSVSFIPTRLKMSQTQSSAFGGDPVWTHPQLTDPRTLNHVWWYSEIAINEHLSNTFTNSKQFSANF